MMNLKPVYLKTYGKQTRKLSAWISPVNRKQAFDSTLSTDGDISVFEPSKPTKREKKASVCKRRVARPAKKKAMLCLTEKNFDEDNIPYPRSPPPDQQIKITRETIASGSRDKAVRPPKRKPVLHLLKTSSDEENICRPCDAQPCQQSRTARKSRLVSAPRVFMKGQKFPVTSESDEDSTSNANDLTHSGHKKRNSNVPLPSAGRFVTRRRRAAAKPKLPKERSCNLNSSDDFTSGTYSSRRILRPSRRMRAPPAFLTSGAENSANAAMTSSFAANPFQEMSLNELADYSLRLRPKKPMFCSTPSADPVCKRPCLTPLSISDRSATSQSMSVSCISISSTFQAVLVSPEQPVSLKPTGLSSEEKLQMNFGEQEPSGDIFMDAMSSNKRSSFSKEAESHGENLCTDNSESSSHFMSAAGGLEWLTEALKEKCLTERCSVQLERLNYYSNTVSQLPNQSICNLNSLTVSHSTSYSLSIDSEPMEQSAPALFECTHQTEGSVEFITDTELLANSHIHTLFTAEEVAAVKDKSLTQKCTVQLQKLDLSQLKEDRLTRNEKSANSNAKESENNGTDVIDEPEGVTCSGKVTERISFLVPQPISNSRPVYLTRLDGPEAEEKAAVTTMRVMEKCLKDKFQVKVEKLPVSELKKILLLRNSKPTYVSDSDRADQTESHQQSDTDTNHWNENIPAMRVNMNKRSSTSSRDKIPSEKEEVVKDARNIPHKRKKTSLTLKENKRRSTSTDRTGTIRKACVSGLSVNRWRNKNQTSTYTSSHRAAGGGCYKTGDCSISELIPSQNKQPWVRTTCTQELLGTTMNFSTPVKASRLNLSSLLTELTPNTHTWSRLKAALSVHRKVLLTPKNSNPWASPGRSDFADVSQDLFATPFRSLLPKRLRSQRQDSLIECENIDLSDAEKVYAECGQQCPLPWEECIIPQYMKQCVKIGEGTFGEVFSFTNVSGDTVALKIIPVEGSKQVNGEDQKAFGEILHEIIISKELSSLKEKQQNQTLGFIGLNNLHCVQGYYPPDFLNAWDAFDQKKGSENDRPDFFEKDQIFLILEFEFGGIDLENSNGMLMSLGVAKSILHQVTAALAVAEQCLNFEHRDLHWGNVLVKKTKAKKGSFLLNGAAHSFETKGVLVRIIDYSLSRLEIDDLTVSCDISNDEELFMGQGDYQFDIYRLMRQENGNNWSNYHPHTNILWLHYLCSKLLSMKYRGTGGRAAKDMREALTRFYDNVLEYSSATEALHKCPVFQ